MSFKFHVMAFFIGCAMTPALLWADEEDEGYLLPITEGYAIRKVDSGYTEKHGSRHLVELMTGESSSLSTSNVVSGVVSYAVLEKHIVGKTTDGYFLLDVGQWREWAQPETFKTLKGWQLALKKADLPVDIAMLDPDVEALKFSDQVLHPWKYRMMKGAFGLTDDYWSLVVQLAGMAICLLMGFFAPMEWRLLPRAVLIGWISNIIGQILIAGGGPGAFVGFVALPICCFLAAAIGRGIRLVISGRSGEIRV